MIMVIYVEYVILDNFALDFFIATLVCRFYSIRKWRGLLSAIIGTCFALCYPIIPNFLLAVYKVVTFLFSVIPLIFRTSLKQSFKVASLYLILSTVFCGLISLLVGSNGVYYGNGGMVFIICIISLAIFLIANRIIVRTLQKGKFEYVKVEIEKNSYKGFFDNGNKVIGGDGNGVVFLDKKLSRLFKNVEPSDFVFTHTVLGDEIKGVIIIPKLKIYFNGELHTYINVNAIKTDKSFKGFDILLSQNLKENGK